MVISCSSPVNTVSDRHFSKDGIFLDQDSAKSVLIPEPPVALGFFVEVSGSMNGFFRSNFPTRFKKDVWSIVSNFGGNDIYVLSDSGTVSGQYPVAQFKSRMNSGGFVSSAETLVPDMLDSILERIDYNAGECAVLISDMKYSPELQKDVNVLLEQYQTDIRNVIGKYQELAVCLIMATSDFLSPGGSVIEEDSPYYYLVLGKDENVAYMRNRIATLLDDNGDYGESIEAGFDYGAPSYTFGIPDNAVQLPGQPTFFGYDTSYSDTCTINVKIDLSSYRWCIADKDVLRKCIDARMCYGSNVDIGNINIDIDNHYNKEFRRQAIADVELKIYGMSYTDSDVVEWTLNHPDKQISRQFADIILADDEKDYGGSFSLDRFIAGVFNAIQNSWDETPERILISKTK